MSQPDIGLKFQIVNAIKLAPDLLPETFTIDYFTSSGKHTGIHKIRVKDSSCSQVENWLQQAHLTPPKGRNTIDWYTGATSSGILVILNRVDHKAKPLRKPDEYFDFEFDGIKYRIQRMPDTDGGHCWNSTVYINID